MKIAILLTCAIVLLFAAIKCFSKRKKKFEKAILKCRKFLFLKGEEQKFLKDYLSKIENNLPKVYDTEVNFGILKNAGLFLEKEVLKVAISQFSLDEKKELFALNKFNEKNLYSVFVLVNQNTKASVLKFIERCCLKNLKLIEVEIVHPKLIFEINKLNLNYSPTSEKICEGIFFDNQKVDCYKYKNYRLESECLIKNKKINCYKILKIPKNENIFSFNNLKTVEIIDCENIDKIKYVKKLCSSFVIGRKNGNEIELKYLEKIEKIYFSNNNFEFFIKKSQKNVFLIVKFKKNNKNIQKNSILCICAHENMKIEEGAALNYLLSNYISINAFFNINFLSVDGLLNRFINFKLKDIVCKHFLFGKECGVFKEIESLDLLKCRTTRNFAFVKQLLNDVLGIKVLNGNLHVCPKDFVPNFEFCINGKLIKFERRKGKNVVEISGRQFVNLGAVDLKKIDGNEITFCG